ncbi:dCTP pyrophosphatase 1-like [Glandiceps talaboti]
MMTTNAASPDVPEAKKCRRETEIRTNGTDTTETEFKFAERPTLEQIRQMQSEFAKERDFNKFHTPRNLLLAMVGEVGEVAELFQWRGETKDGLPDWSEKDRTHLSQELSDVLIYLVRLAEKCHIDLPSATVEKIALNHKKYPASKVHGSCKKYNEYD